MSKNKKSTLAVRSTDVCSQEQDRRFSGSWSFTRPSLTMCDDHNGSLRRALCPRLLTRHILDVLPVSCAFLMETAGRAWCRPELGRQPRVHRRCRD